MSVFTLAALLLAGCQKDVRPGLEANTVLESAFATSKAVVTVDFGSSIQTAVNAASAGSVIKIRPGTYRESIVIDKPGITLVGDGNVVIENPGDADIGITVQDVADGFVLKSITVSGFEERGVELKNVDGFLLSHVKAISNGEFGLFVQYSTNGTIEHGETTGHSDTGIFVGESTNVSVSHNKAHGNTIGIETENASHVTIDKNHAYNNTAGILSLLVPHPTVTQSSHITITKNQVRENNHANLQTGSGELETILPSGIGILLLGTDNTLVRDNHVTGNQYTGVAVVSTAIFQQIDPNFPLAGIEPHPDYTRVIGNQLKNNGYKPQSAYLPPLPGVDLLWLGPAIGEGIDNCWYKNVYSTSFPNMLPACQ